MANPIPQEDSDAVEEYFFYESACAKILDDFQVNSVDTIARAAI